MLQPHNKSLRYDLENKLISEYDFYNNMNWYNMNMLIHCIKTYNVHPELQSFVTSFQAKMKMAGRDSRIIDLEAHFSDSLGNTTQGNIIGTCQRQNITRDKGLTVETVETPIIKINRAGYILTCFCIFTFSTGGFKYRSW